MLFVGLGKFGRVSGCGLWAFDRCSSVYRQQLVTRSPNLGLFYLLRNGDDATCCQLRSGGLVWLVNSFFVLSCFGTSMDYLRCS